MRLGWTEVDLGTKRIWAAMNIYGHIIVSDDPNSEDCTVKSLVPKKNMETVEVV